MNLEHQNIQNLVYEVRGKSIMLDFDLAILCFSYLNRNGVSLSQIATTFRKISNIAADRQLLTEKHVLQHKNRPQRLSPS